MLVAESIKILKKINDLLDLSGENVIENIKNEFTLAIKQEKDQTKRQAIQAVYKSWEDDDFNIDHSFENKFRYKNHDYVIECTLLHLAARNSHVELVNALIAKGADIKAADNECGGTPLHWAAKADNTTAPILYKGADVNIPDNDGYTPLHWAAKAGNTEVVKLLLDKGAEVNIHGSDGHTPLHWAAKETYGVYVYTRLHLDAKTDNTEVVALLLGRGAEVNAEDDNGYTPLHSAARNCTTHVAKLLLAKGANPSLKNDFGKTPIDLAENEEMRELLKEEEEKAKMPVNNGEATPLLESNEVKTPIDFAKGQEMTKPSKEAEKAYKMPVIVGVIIGIISTSLIAASLVDCGLSALVIAGIAVGCGIVIGAIVSGAVYMLLKPSTEIKVEQNVEKHAEPAIAA